MSPITHEACAIVDRLSLGCALDVSDQLSRSKPSTTYVAFFRTCFFYLLQKKKHSPSFPVNNPVLSTGVWLTPGVRVQVG
jgi:hypothetical protein